MTLEEIFAEQIRRFYPDADKETVQNYRRMFFAGLFAGNVSGYSPAVAMEIIQFGANTEAKKKR